MYICSSVSVGVCTYIHYNTFYPKKIVFTGTLMISFSCKVTTYSALLGAQPFDSSISLPVYIIICWYA
jgi:hypothetical protein